MLLFVFFFSVFVRLYMRCVPHSCNGHLVKVAIGSAFSSQSTLYLGLFPAGAWLCRHAMVLVNGRGELENASAVKVGSTTIENKGEIYERL